MTRPARRTQAARSQRYFELSSKLATMSDRQLTASALCFDERRLRGSLQATGVLS
jgi:hypothetical protein